LRRRRWGSGQAWTDGPESTSIIVQIGRHGGRWERDYTTGYDGCVAVLTPQPGWRRWGKQEVYAPYKT